MADEMKGSFFELAAETTTATAGVTIVQGKMWLQKILETAKHKMVFEQFGTVVTVPNGIKDYAVPISTSNKTFTSFSTEATARTNTEIDNVTCKTFTPATRKYGATISKDIVRTSQVDMVEFARTQMAYSVALQIDTAFSTALVAASSPAASLWGGDATSTAEDRKSVV